MKKTLPKISIIVPIYNTQEYLNDCINSLLSQTYQNFEIILINDGSKDNSLDICRKFADRDARIVIIDKVNTGVSDSRNRGLSVAGGEYITFTDSDDWVEPTYIQEMYENLVSHDADISICNWFRHKRQVKKSKQVRNIVVGSCSPLQALKDIFTAKRFLGYCCNKLFKKEILGDLKFDTTTHYQEDMMFCYHYIKKCKKLVYTNKKLYHYIKTPKSISGFHFSPKKMSVLDGMQKVIEDARLYYPEIEPYMVSWYYLCNIEMLFYVIRQKPKNRELINSLKINLEASYEAYHKIKPEYNFPRRKAKLIYNILKLF